jgi:hypothetical protein
MSSALADPALGAKDLLEQDRRKKKAKRMARPIAVNFFILTPPFQLCGKTCM